ncbi:uncharacterized protein MYCFIDRAFT_215035 [Pseudocercospora fijiensis CIRAD86]|uniref:Uncharacterized protein n=1 Tax=Pseudocercospora fijiensis (strain CIRAD86) TaxID=383855 RepID=M2YYA8_PSEFD|nr:uncharacterized protein MYCFIDRAFT_215035 [Pseudocercospora fijiensis CIRAD86]EME82635.1 hypothetical protein MYCFIDRAFT_215035 [Pseudocercospora fijiensis CIRAD86]
MPTFKSAGVSATLFSCELSDSIADPILPSAKEAARVASALRTGRTLDEKPIGVDGGSRGVLRYIGEHEDMPLMMVEAGDHLRRDWPPVSVPDLDSSLSSIDSALTSLGPTPTPSPANAQRYLAHSHAHPAPSIEPVSPLSAFYRTFPSKQALRLAVKTLPAAHVYTGSEKPKSIEIDLKIEVFVNGDLANSEFINTKRVSMSNERYFHGTRIDTQVEKPWVYDASAHLPTATASMSPKHPGPRPTSEDGGEVNARWKSISSSLATEASARSDTPTGSYLDALAAVPIPHRLEGAEQLGVIDVLVTTGRGYKYAPNRGYINRPTRMDNRKSKTRKAPSGNEGDTAQQPPRKKSKLDHAPNQLSHPQDSTISSDSVAELAQERADMVVDQGADPGGHLMGSIARLSPHKPPVIREGSSSSTVEQAAPNHPRDSVEPGSDVREQSNGDTFIVPDACRGSTVTYDANPACQRHVSKVRPGFFEENQVVVGMRYVVL